MSEKYAHACPPDPDPEIHTSDGPDSPENDPELERDYLLLAQWLLDVDRELREKKRGMADGEIDSSRPRRTM